MITDKKTIGLAPHTREVMNQLMQARVFRDQMDAAKFAMALAINANIGAEPVEGTGTVWNVGSFDPDGALKTVISALFPDAEIPPYRHIEILFNKGLEIIGNHMAEKKALDLVQLMLDNHV